MLRKSEIMLLTAGLLIGAVAGLLVGYGIHDSPAQGDVSTLLNNSTGTSVNSDQIELVVDQAGQNNTPFAMANSPMSEIQA
ncbi:hypothetical protein [Methanocella sp. MCL-LM]|uniref:hypothetical protein n=1 Tax=Methanocella sp. MCL-LM TaxID=3412035 RepID=UPI003C74DC31